MMDIPDPSKLLEPKLNINHFRAVLEKSHASVAAEDLKPFEEFTESYGQERLLGRAVGGIALAEAETVEKGKQALLKEAVTDCELVLQQAPENVRALYLRGRAGALRADGLVQQASQLRELRYAKGLFWKAGELDRDDQKIEHERVTMNKRLQEKEEEVNADLSGPRAVLSRVRYINKRSIAVEVHWVKIPATESHAGQAGSV